MAVSGGVDSMALLHLLKERASTNLIVAHFDHGIRANSAEDRRLVQQIAESYGLPFVYDEGELGPDASEAKAREARYNFLRKVVKASGAKAIITAHHQDDVLETAIINLLRGTGRKGLSSLASKKDVLRPLLSVPKKELIKYAKEHKLKWSEDPTNLQTEYLRNYIRLKLLPKLSGRDKAKLLGIINNTRVLNKELDSLLAQQLEVNMESNKLARKWFTGLPHEVSKEVLASWLRNHGLASFDRKLLERVTVAAKTSQPGAQIDLQNNNFIGVEKDHLALKARER